MPDNKLSLSGLKEHLRKYLGIYLLVIAITLVGCDLLWTTTRPQLYGDEIVKIYLTANYSNSDPLNGIAADMLARAREVDETVGAVEFESLYYVDPSVDYNGSLVLITRLAVGEGDAFIASAEAMDSLCVSDTLKDLTELVEGGWLAEYHLEPYYYTRTDEETGESRTLLLGLRLDSLTALARLGAMDNEGALLCLADNGDNPETTLRALEVMMKELTEASDAGTEDTQPSA